MDCQDGAGPSDIARYARSLSHRSKTCRQWWPKQHGWTMVGRQRSRGGGQMDVASYLLNIAVSNDGRLIACGSIVEVLTASATSTWRSGTYQRYPRWPIAPRHARQSARLTTVQLEMVNRSYHTGKIKCFHVSESLFSQWTEWNIRTNNRPTSMPEQATDRETTRRQQVFFSPYFCAYDAPADKCACNATTQTNASATHPTISAVLHSTQTHAASNLNFGLRP